MAEPVSKLTIKGYKSIKELVDFELGSLNVLIGANGAGKSNFVSFFSLLRAIVDESLRLEITRFGGAATHLYLGSKVTSHFSAEVEFGPNVYSFALERTANDEFVFAEEDVLYYTPPHSEPRSWSLGTGRQESHLKEARNRPGRRGGSGVESYVFESVSSWMVYHFHDTSDTAPARTFCPINHNEQLERDAGNIAAFLLKIREDSPATYRLIRDTVRMVAPFFDDFNLRETNRTANTETLLEWKQKGVQQPFHPSQLSDGTLRFICLTTALLQPNPPATIVIDEPELGLHPYALGILAGLIKKASSNTQVIVSTQSATLLDHFQPEDVIVVDRKDGASTFERLNPDKLSEWLDDYTLGDLWQRNYLSGGPVHE
ncbi:MAG: AAA family ATPase [Planctomycetes bacterium]|nr:AAA family ATPase [Planctomycetota bacterium]